MPKEQELFTDDYSVDPNHWAGHSFADDCEWIDLGIITPRDSVSSRGSLRNAEKKLQRKMEGQTRSVIDEFYELSGGEVTPLTKYAMGQLFDSSRLSAGAIYRENYNSVWTVGERGIDNGTYCLYGVLFEADFETKAQLLVAKYLVGLVRPVYRGFFSPETIEVGRVEHTKFSNISPKKIDLQSIRQLTSVELVLPGRGSPKRLNEPKTSPSFGLKLNPQLG